MNTKPLDVLLVLAALASPVALAPAEDPAASKKENAPPPAAASKEAAPAAIPLEITDPVFLPYFRRAMSSWVLRPAQLKGTPVESWNELAMSGTISFDDEIKQISTLRRVIGP